MVQNFLNDLKYVQDWDSFWWFFNNQPENIQIFMGFALFGICVLVYIFFVAIFIDKD